MTAAQGRAIRELDEALAESRRARDHVMDLLLAVLAHHGGEVRIPEGTVMTTTRQAIHVDTDHGVLIIRTARRAADAEAASQRRIRGIIRGVIGRG